MESPLAYMVSVGPSPTSEDLVHSAARLARESGARLIAVSVDTWSPATLPAQDREQLDRNLEVASDLGAEVVVLRGRLSAQELVAYARTRGVRRLILGRNRDKGLERLWRRPFRPGQVPVAADLEIVTLETRNLDVPEESENRTLFRFQGRHLVFTALALAASVLSAWLVREAGAPRAVQVLCLVLGVVLVSGTLGLAPGILASVVAVLVFNYAFTEPLYTLWVDDPWNWLVFFLVLVVGVVVGAQTHRLEFQARLLRNRERRLEALSRLGRALALAETKEDVARVSGPHLSGKGGALRESLEVLVSSALERVSRARAAQAALFLQGISHDFRTPLAILGGTARSLAESTQGRLTPGESTQLATIEGEARELGRQMGLVLDLSRLVEPDLSLRFQWVPAEELLFSCRDAFRPRVPGRTLSLSVPTGLPMVWVEPALVERALLNLMENADRYSPPGERILLSFGETPGIGEFRVGDRGPGVPDEEKDRIFDKFYRGSIAKGLPGVRGTGLGLALVRETARVHGGTAGVRDRPGGGAEFWMSFPIPEGAPEEFHD